MVLAAPLTWAGEGAAGGLEGTVHDFTNTGEFVPGDSGGTLPSHDGDSLDNVGLCTYCHTPHKAISTTLLWNHTLSSSNFSWDATSTTAGTTFPTISGQTYKGVTAKCLSCHDGTVAIGDVAWFYEGTQAPINGTQHDDPTEGANIANGGDLSGNHPVAMPFPYQNQASTYNGVTTGSAATLSEWVSDPTANGIRLFNDDGAGNITAGAVLAKTGIECSSCHDPHNKQTADDLFLRGTLTGSDSNYICLKCHNK
jgi:hypothetical protein